jgi:hypothetical protein
MKHTHGNSCKSTVCPKKIYIGENRRWLSSGLLRRVVSYKITEVSEMLAAFIIRDALMTEVAIMSETSVILYQTTRRNNPEDSHLRTCRRKNLKSHKKMNVHVFRLK